MIILRKAVVTFDVFYYIPKTSIINEFVWQFEDDVPSVPRAYRFLEHVPAQ
jgi:uncharacterized protein Usg